MKTVIELNRNGKFIDVALQTNDSLICIEVAMTSAHEKENIEKDFSLSKADYVIVACKDKKVKKEVQEIVSEMPEQFRNKTEVCLLSELLNKKPEDFVRNL
jgi:predicted GTPase